MDNCIGALVIEFDILDLYSQIFLSTYHLPTCTCSPLCPTNVGSEYCQGNGVGRALLAASTCWNWARSNHKCDSQPPR